MFELFHMDIRRMIKDKKFYAILICILGAVFLFRLICAPSSVPFLNMLTGNLNSNLNELEEFLGMPQIEFLQSIMHSGFLSLLCCVYAGLFICADFEYGFYKHIFSVHAKESHYILSKLMFSALLAFIICITAGISAVIVSNIPGFELPVSLAMDGIVLLVQEWIVMTGFCSLMLFCSVLIKNKSVLGISIVAGVGLLIYAISIFANSINHPEIERAVLKFSLFGAENNCMTVYHASSFWAIIGVSFAWISFYGILSMLVLKRKF